MDAGCAVFDHKKPHYVTTMLSIQVVGPPAVSRCPDPTVEVPVNVPWLSSVCHLAQVAGKVGVVSGLGVSEQTESDIEDSQL